MGLLFGIICASGAYFEFLGCVIGTCAVLYVFFLCRMLGAGDIKLMAVCMGILGFRNGIAVMLISMTLALLHSLIKFVRNGVFWGQELRLAPYLLGGYCVYLMVWQGYSLWN